ncbi:MAG TPA: DUF5107 domain-containing protein [Terracidiphilus sp.]|jgi:hypothetical protein
MLRIHETTEFLLTHAIVPVGPIPTCYDPDGIYPYESFCETSRRPEIRSYRLVTMENEQIRVKVCPDLGARVCSLFLKEGGTEALFFPQVVRPVRILPRQSFTGGGIELSFPISHTPVEIAPVLYESTRKEDRVYVCCGEREIKFGMHWTVEYSLGEDDDFLTQRTVFFNPGPKVHPWMSWSNAGVPARPDTVFDFPGGPVLVHDAQIRTIAWETQGPRSQSDVRRMTGYFWQKPDCSAFGAFTPSLGVGLYHVADPTQMPGIKLWSDGIGRDEAWVSQYTMDGAQCLEIQAGPLVDQSLKATLQPGRRHEQVEFWIPSQRQREIHSIVLPTPRLRPLDEVPLFSWARQEEFALWLQIVDAWKVGDALRIPLAPDIDSNRWAPSGMAELGDALAWAASHTASNEPDRWLFQHGAWLAGCGAPDAALDVLSKSRDDRALALAGRLWRVLKHAPEEAAKAFRAIQSPTISHHPQVIIERDKALAALGPATIDERQCWLDAVSALEDEWLAERRVSLLLDQGDAQAAHDVLIGTRFQRVHQRYERTRLWRLVESMLGLEPVAYPSWLGEDDLAEFGAYREHIEPAFGSDEGLP